jgi:hypothetical protein
MGRNETYRAGAFRAVHGTREAIASPIHRMARWSNTTPFGAPVVPDV